MKVLQVNCVYKNGSTGKIVYDLHTQLLEQGVESIVCYGRGAEIVEDNVYKTCPEWYAKLNKLRSMFTGIMYNGCFFSTNRLITVISNEKPDIVHLQCINGYFVNIYRLLNWLKRNHIKTVLTLHAEFMYTGGCGYSIECNQWSTRTGCGHSTHCPRWRAETKSLFIDRTKTMWMQMKDAFDGFEELVVTSVSPWLMRRAKESFILGDKEHCVVMNGLNTDVFYPRNTVKERMQFGINNKKIILHVTASFSIQPNHIKGGSYIVEMAEKMANSNVVFLVVGPYEENIIVSSNIILLGKITDQIELAKYYSMADVTVLTSQRETFSMVTAESLCCGTPVVGFKAGAPEQISIPEYSSFVDYGDLDGLCNEVIQFINNDKDEILPVIAEKKYSIEAMTKAYIDCYNSLLEKGLYISDES